MRAMSRSSSVNNGSYSGRSTHASTLRPSGRFSQRISKPYEVSSGQVSAVDCKV
jgi:hypothetical protein